MLNQLYEKGFHRRLHLFVDYISQPPIDRIALMHGMEKIYFYYGQLIALPPMPYLRELCFDDYTRLENLDLDFVAKNFVNLERVFFKTATANEIIPFVRYARMVNEIKVEKCYDIENGFVDLLALNKMRKELSGACKITIYINEKVFLSTKFAMTRTQFNLVILKRAEGVDDLGVFNY